jgi:putative oxidoreductase
MPRHRCNRPTAPFVRLLDQQQGRVPSIMEPFTHRIRAGIQPGLAPIPVRLIVGYGFMEHGLAKLGRGVDSFAQVLHAIGMPFPSLLAWATVAVEVLGGLAVLLGAFVAIASVPMLVVLLVAIVTVHLPNGFSSIKLQSYGPDGAHFGQPGYECDLLYVAGIVTLVLGGSGPLSLDRLIAERMAATRPAALGRR